jgi:glycosyltransferase involved in cell wall biosynthesis
MASLVKTIRKSIKGIIGVSAADRVYNAGVTLSRAFAQLKWKLHYLPWSPFSLRLARTVPRKFRIGMAVMAHERPEYLDLCLDSLFTTNLYDYDITFLLQDDGSTDPRVREIIEKPRDPKFRIVRYFTPKGHDSWGAAFNKAMKKLLEMDDFDIIGTCDSDTFFHPEWLNQTMKIGLWAKRHHCKHILGPFSAFNSSNRGFHKILGTYPTPHGSIVVKYRMDAKTYFYFKPDFLRLGFFAEDKDDETLMTKHFDRLGVRNFCTETSYVEHIGHSSVLNQWRPKAVDSADYGMNLPAGGWPARVAELDTLGYYRFIKQDRSFGEGVSSDDPLDILIPLAAKDVSTFKLVIGSIRRNLRHPIGQVFVVGPALEEIKSACSETGCVFKDENTVLPITKEDIQYTVNGVDRSGWLFQQLIKLNGRKVCDLEEFLALDADTILACPQVFKANGQTVFLHSDEHHTPYYQAYWDLFGRNTSTPLSFVAHQMLFNRGRLLEMQGELETRHGKPWYQAILSTIDTNELSAFSEFEIYGHWMLQIHPAEVRREYWFNRAVPRREISLLAVTEEIPGCRSVSCHSY